MEIIINDNSPDPVYYQIYQQLKKRIEDNVLKPGDRLPSERDLSEQLGVHRNTIRKAVQDMISEGFCTKKRGKGIFVSKGKIQVQLHAVQGLSKYLTKRGYSITTRVIQMKVVHQPEDLYEKLQVRKGTSILCLKRLRIIEDEPHVIETAFLSLDRMPGLEKKDLSCSLYKIIQDEYKLFPDHSIGVLRFILADGENARLLNIQLNSPVIEKDVTVYSAKNVPIEYVQAYHRGDRFEFSYHTLSMPK